MILQQLYKEKAIPALMERFKYTNVNQVPKLVKIVVSIGMGEAKDNPKAMDAAAADLTAITGQKPVVTTAKKSVANFKVRQGMKIGLMVTLRGARMYDFANKLINIALPRVRDFRGLNLTGFDGRGNYAMGLKEQLIFPEIIYDNIDKIRGMNLVFVTTAKTDEEARWLLTELGMPFKKA
ncbi:MAG TPA: 50S ribosomal protein L5 [Clostridia bacterium]|jgi:large subunit ribosomal protein L5|nr:50S ribosomal protein L5 [Clostridia bacterium]HOM33776.1 50S ribosomal protein L5 [Clostridia bacterium]HOR89081.1 50S ribosomal protein L5 [Clostridia bacterium]HOT69850.1 50S ribosomal protein L5 [Clostridia bacterium]HPL08607.1 50S ribosomal protein L5 [Clostridia bacterium]